MLTVLPVCLVFPHLHIHYCAFYNGCENHHRHQQRGRNKEKKRRFRKSFCLFSWTSSPFILFIPFLIFLPSLFCLPPPSLIPQPVCSRSNFFRRAAPIFSHQTQCYFTSMSKNTQFFCMYEKRGGNRICGAQGILWKSHQFKILELAWVLHGLCSILEKFTTSQYKHGKYTDNHRETSSIWFSGP